MIIIIISSLLLNFIIGYTFPKQSLWVLVLVVPLIYPTNIILLDAPSLPITIERFAIFMIIGSCLRQFNLLKEFIKRSSSIKYFFLFALVLVLGSSRDMHVKTVIFTYLIDIIIGILLPVLIIKKINDVELIFKILVIQSAILSFLVILEYFTKIQINVFTLAPKIAANYIGDIDAPNLFREGYFRPNGIDGSSVQTAYRLVMLLPLTLYHIFSRQNVRSTFLFRLIRFVPFFLIVISIVLLQSRAASFIAFGGLIILIRLTIFSKRFRIINYSKIIRITLPLILCIILFLFFFQDYIDLFTKSIYDPIFNSNVLEEGIVRDRDYSFWLGFDLFLQKPFFGYGSPLYSAFIVMDYLDIPSFLIYLLSGGLVLFFFYLTFWFNVFSILYRQIKLVGKSDTLQIYIFVFVSVILGFSVTLSNWCESHFLVLFLLIFSSIKLHYITDGSKSS